MGPSIHSSALVDPKATLGTGVVVGAFSIVGPEVILGDGVEIGHHVILEGRVEIGSRCRIGHGAQLGGAPQDFKFKPGTPSGVRVGADTVIREYVTIHRATQPEGWTDLGPNCLVMAVTHIAHDCRLGQGVIVISHCAIAGHCQFDDYATLGGNVGLPPFSRVGTFAYVGGYSKLEQDLPPYMLANGIPATVRGINNVGLRRAGVSAADRRLLKEAYRLLYRSGLSPRSALDRIGHELPAVPAIERLVAFVAASSRRGICPPPVSWRESEADVDDIESERIV